MSAISQISLAKVPAIGTLPEPLQEIILSDVLTLLKSIHRMQKEGALRGPFLFTSNLKYADDIWHEFILNTRAYVKFCNDQFGEYMHHEPAESPTGELAKIQTDDIVKMVDNQIALLQEYNGTEFANKIYTLYPTLIKGLSNENI
ncbi:MAG: hypothetical protein EOP04_27315 [Proteobacteria bacterium]|nr:MAG: hypothetical protein EOP04_27315 [Pseudomonadota bacterium]